MGVAIDTAPWPSISPTTPLEKSAHDSDHSHRHLSRRATVVAAIFTSHQLGIMRKAIYQLESAAGELRRQLEDMETEKRQAAGRISALRHLR